MNAPHPSAPAASGKGAKTACVVVGCAVAAIFGFIALLGVLGFYFYHRVADEVEKVQARAQAANQEADLVDPAPIGFPSRDDSRGDLPAAPGPDLGAGDFPGAPLPADKPFALITTVAAPPDPLANVGGIVAAEYHASAAGSDLLLPFTLSFAPHPDGTDPEENFQAVLRALSDDETTVPYDGFTSFTLTEGEEEVAAVFVNMLEFRDALHSVTVFDNGVTVASFDRAASPEVEAAFPSLRDLSVEFHKQLALAWHGARGGSESPSPTEPEPHPQPESPASSSAPPASLNPLPEPPAVDTEPYPPGITPAPKPGTKAPAGPTKPKWNF